jgi:hypothetical protein
VLGGDDTGRIPGLSHLGADAEGKTTGLSALELIIQ